MTTVQNPAVKRPAVKKVVVKKPAVKRTPRKKAAPTLSIDLGCGSNLRNLRDATSAWGVDLESGANIRKADLALEPIPWEDSSADYITAIDFLEHIPRLMLFGDGKRRYPFIDLMSEVWRVLKPGGQFLAMTPALPHPEAFVDPTHVNYITEGTLDYFLNGTADGFKGQFVGEQTWHEQVPYWLVWNLMAVK